MTQTTFLRALSGLAAAILAAAGVLFSTGSSAGPAEPATLVARPAESTTTAVPPTTVSPTTEPSTTPAPTTVPPTTVPIARRSTAVPPATTTTTPVVPVPLSTTANPATLRPGDAGDEVLALQRRLQALGYWLGTADGNYGSLTEQAVTAFQKVEGLQPEGIAGPDTAGALAQAVRPQPRSDHGDLLEVDKQRQVLLVVREGSVAWVVNTSTGNGRPYQSGGVSQVAETPSGRWTVSRAVDGVRQAPLGSLYRPRYFHADGIAVHGSPSVPPYPASHGCVRVTDAAMDFIWASDAMPMGSTVWVYD